MRVGLLVAGGLAVVLAALLALQLLAPWNAPEEAGDLTGVIPASRTRVAPPRPAEPTRPTLHADEWVATILARPLFTRDRRPVDATSTVAASSGGGSLPRLTGVAITPDLRRAFFAGPEGGKPVVVDEGGNIAGFTVQAIGPGEVKLQGPSGERTVTVAFDPAPATPRPDADITPTSIVQPPYGAPPPYGQFPAQAPPTSPPPALPPPLPNAGLGRFGAPLDPSGMPQNRPGPIIRPRATLDDNRPASRPRST